MTNFFTLQDLGLATSSDQLLGLWLSYMQSVYPGYTPSAANLEYILAVIFSTWAADVNTQASTGATELFKQFGQQLIGVAPQNGTAATASVSVTAVDTQGYTLPSGTQFVLDNTFAFYAVTPLVIPAGSQSGTVTIASATFGSQYNGAGQLSGAQLNQQLNWVLAVNLASPALGGADPETSEAYLNRLALELQLLAPRPITASDYGIFVLNFKPAPGTDQVEVGRATAIDGYDPDFNSYNNEREVSVCVVDSTGDALNSDTMNAIQAWLSTVREINFIIHVVQPNYSPIYVTASVARNIAYDVATVQSNVQAALSSFLDPSSWGQPMGTGNRVWNNTPVIRYSQLESVVQGASGVAYVVSLKVGLAASPSGTTDLTMPGPFPLPTTAGDTTIPLTSITVVN